LLRFGCGGEGGVVALLQSPSMFPLSSQIIGINEPGRDVQPTGTLHAGLV